MSAKTYTIVGLGEVLWDVFPEGKQLGGAPANFAYMVNMLGDRGIIASRVGADPLGDEAREKMALLGLETSFLQRDSIHPTGTVKVQVDREGQPTYAIADPAAWDFLAWEPGWSSLAQQADAVCFGSLAQRHRDSRETVRTFLRAARPGTARIFDVNLRQAFYSAEVIVESAKLADIIKLTREELPRVLGFFGLPHDDDLSSARRLLRACGAKLVCLTRGSSGSLLVSENASDEHPGLRVPVVDTVGAGDGFAAALVHHFLRGAVLVRMNDAANRMGAWIVGCAGATPPPDPAMLQQIRVPSG